MLNRSEHRETPLRVATIVSILSACLVAQAVTLHAGQVRLLSSNGLKAAVEAHQSVLEELIGQMLITDFSTAASLKTRIEAGEDFDVAILTPALLDDLVNQQRISAPSRRQVAQTGVGVGVRTDAPPSDVSSTESLKRVLLDADSVAFTADGQSRRTIDRTFDVLAIADTMRPRTMLVGPGQGPALVVAGDAALVLTLVSEIVSVPGLQLLGPLPDELQGYVVFAAGLSTNSANPAAAEELIKSFSEPAFVTVLEGYGMGPP
jgi:molybdate transport system substrate-binding protein